VVRRICAAGNPLKIVLFGSHARGQAHPYSDLDLLIIEESDLPRHERSVKYYLAIAGLYPATDIVVWTPDEAYDWSQVRSHFITTALREGKTIYEESA
jgi:predicted nucleotidyltransferase